MISKASVDFVRISPRKVRYVIDMIRKKPVPQAQTILNGSPRRAGGIVRKLLDPAVHAAVKNSNIDSGNLFVSMVIADGASTMKRFRAASMGRASVIRKRTSHIHLELDTIRKQVAVSPEKKSSSKKTGQKKMAGAR